MEELRNWLNSDRPYHQGIELYARYGQDPVLLSLFRKPDVSPFKEERLFQAIRDLFRASKAKSRSVPRKDAAPENRAEMGQKLAITQKPSIPKERSGWPLNNCGPILIALKTSWEPIYKEMQTLRAQLLLMDSQADRGAAAHRILALDDQCDEIYQQRDYYLENRALPEAKEPERVVDPVKWPVRLQSAKRYIRRYTQKLEKDPSNAKYAELLQQYQDEVDHYSKLLNIG